MDRQRKIYKATLWGSFGNLLLLSFKFVAGFVGHSSAMIADAVHSLSDLTTDIIVLLFVRISGKSSDEDHRYGHGKYETLATVVIGLILMAVGGGLLWDGSMAIWRYIHGEMLNEPRIVALIAAFVSIVVKEALYQYTIRVGKSVNSQAVIANAWHHRSDALSSIGTTIGIGGAILLGEKWRVLDPIAAVLVSILIIKVAFELFIPSINELLEKSLPKEIEKQIIDAIAAYPQVSDPHNLRTRRIGPICSIDIHIRMDGNMTVNDSHEITRQIEEDLRKVVGKESILNIHVEPQKVNHK